MTFLLLCRLLYVTRSLKQGAGVSVHYKQSLLLVRDSRAGGKRKHMQNLPVAQKGLHAMHNNTMP